MTKRKTDRDTLLAEVASCREAIAGLDAERTKLLRTPIPRREALERLDAYIAALGGRWDAGSVVHALTARDAYPAGELIGRGVLRAGNAGVGSVGYEPVERFIAAVLGEPLRAALVVRVETAYADGDGLGDDELAGRLEALAEQRFELEVREERAIMALEATGDTSVMRRPDADPRAIAEVIE